MTPKTPKTQPISQAVFRLSDSLRQATIAVAYAHAVKAGVIQYLGAIDERAAADETRQTLYSMELRRRIRADLVVIENSARTIVRHNGPDANLERAAKQLLDTKGIVRRIERDDGAAKIAKELLETINAIKASRGGRPNDHIERLHGCVLDAMCNISRADTSFDVRLSTLADKLVKATKADEPVKAAEHTPTRTQLLAQHVLKAASSIKDTMQPIRDNTVGKFDPTTAGTATNFTNHINRADTPSSQRMAKVFVQRLATTDWVTTRAPGSQQRQR